jgi:DNA topoisomerase-1
MERAIELINQKKEADAPIAMYDGKPVTRGKGRFGPYIKWNDMFINVPRRYDFDALSQKDINELVEAKIKKEANRYVQNWPQEKISIENARWGPVLKFGKKILRIPKKADDAKYTAEELSSISLDDVKKMIETQMPDAFVKKAAKKTATKKAAPKKAAKKKKK